MTGSQLTNITHIRAFTFGGNSTFTLVSGKSGTRFTYKVQQKPGATDFFFVSLLTGSENESDYTPCGTIRRHRTSGDWIYRLSWGTLQWAREDSPSQAGIAWFVRRLNADKSIDPAIMEFWGSGTCSACGRKLTDPESLSRGMGPKCFERTMQRI